jgi:hypothetical protein
VIVAAFMIGAGVIMELCAVVGAPVGYQDENGFHQGTKCGEKDDSGFGMNPS